MIKNVKTISLIAIGAIDIGITTPIQKITRF